MPDKDRERRYLTALRHCLHDLPLGEASESERPDFFLGPTPTRIGIEFTEYQHPPSQGERPHQEIQSLQDRVVGLAENLHHEAGGPALYVTAIFGSHGRLSKKTVGPIAKTLATAVLSLDVPGLNTMSVEISRDLLPPEIAHVRVHSSVDGTDRLWQGGAGGWVAQIGPSDVQREITRKERAAGAARERCDALWLVRAGKDRRVHSQLQPGALARPSRASRTEFPTPKANYRITRPPSAADDPGR